MSRYDNIQADLKLLGIKASIQGIYEPIEGLCHTIYFDTQEDMHLYSIVGKFKKCENLLFEIKK